MSLQIRQIKDNYDAILRGLAEEVNGAMKSAQVKIENEVRPAAAIAIADCYEMRSLIGGSLQGHLGIRPGENDVAVFQIAQSVAQSVYVQFQPMTDKKGGFLEILIQPSTFANILSLPAGINKVYSKKYGAYEMPWLDWLITEGDKPIVKGYKYVNDTIGRSGQGIMKQESGESWRVPPEFAGDVNDNYITRALDEPFFIKQLSDILRKNLK